MGKPRAAALLCCLGILPLLGCAAPPATAWRAPPTMPAAAAGPPMPAAVLVVLPGAGMLGADPALWADQGFDVITPSAAELMRYAADREAALDRMLTSAQALGNAPVWLIGGPDIDAMLAANPGLGRGQVSGVVVTSVNTGAGSCSRTVIYQDAGNGSAPKVSVRSSGDACPPDAGAAPAIVAPSPPPLESAKPPRLIEASAGIKASPAAQRALVNQVAQLIRQAPPG
jgi:hypothetical protein